MRFVQKHFSNFHKSWSESKNDLENIILKMKKNKSEIDFYNKINLQYFENRKKKMIKSKFKNRSNIK
jgi:hypothetical protein